MAQARTSLPNNTAFGVADNLCIFRTEKKQTMNIWLIKDGENLPIQPNARKMRMWMLADSLLEKGHSVLWWSSTFSHQRKSLLYHHDIEIPVKDKFRLKLLYSGKYQKNISIQRYLHHRLLAKKFKAQANFLSKPDVIVCAFPIIDLAYEVVKYARVNNIPVIVDIRDPWPDTLVDKYSGFIKSLVKVLVAPVKWQAISLLKDADSLVAISNGLLGWGLGCAKHSQMDNNIFFYIGYPERQSADYECSVRIQDFKSAIGEKIVFTFIGSFGSSYELQLICDVAKTLAKKGYSDVHFALAGDGDQYEKISFLAKSLPSITLLGWLDKNEIDSLLDVTHVGLVPCNSVNDAAPNKPFEYFSAGIPVISSLKGEMEQLIAEKKVGYSYSCGDVETFSEYIILLSQNESLRKLLSENAVKLYESELKADVIYRAYAEHVESIANQKNG